MQSFGRRPPGGEIDLGGLYRMPQDIIALLILLFVTYTMTFLPPFQGLMQALVLSPAAWQGPYLWQLLTYAFVPVTSPLWFLVTLLILGMFGRDVVRVLGRQGFWRMLLGAVLAASLVAVGSHVVLFLLGADGAAPLVLMRGDKILLSILIAAFATLFPNAVIRLFFVLPIKASSFLWLEILFAFVLGYLPTLDFAGFLGICTSVGVTFASLSGGLRRTGRELWLRVQRKYFEQRLRHLRRKRGIRGVKPDEGGDLRRGPWVN